jgi:hypothetical protein
MTNFMSVCSSVCLHACATNCAHSSFFLYCVRLRHAVQVRSFSVQVRLAPVPSARHPRLGPPRIDLSARTPLDVGLLGLAPSDRPLSAQSLGSCCTLLHLVVPCCTLLHPSVFAWPFWRSFCSATSAIPALRWRLAAPIFILFLFFPVLVAAAVVLGRFECDVFRVCVYAVVYVCRACCLTSCCACFCACCCAFRRARCWACCCAFSFLEECWLVACRPTLFLGSGPHCRDFPESDPLDLAPLALAFLIDSVIHFVSA